MKRSFLARLWRAWKSRGDKAPPRQETRGWHSRTLQNIRVFSALLKTRGFPARHRRSPHVVVGRACNGSVEPGWRAAGGGLASSKGQHYCRECTLVARLVYNARCIPATTDTSLSFGSFTPRRKKNIYISGVFACEGGGRREATQVFPTVRVLWETLAETGPQLFVQTGYFE